VAVQLVNELAPRDAAGQAQPRERALPALARVLSVDPPSAAGLGHADVAGFLALARSLRQVFDDLRPGDLDAAASRLNDLLSKHPAHPHLAKEQGRWRLHHHPQDIALVPMWTAICAEAMARMLAAGHGERFGSCEAPGCDRVFFDVSRNASRRFCSTTCQNRVKAAAFRLRQSGRTATSPHRNKPGRRPKRPRQLPLRKRTTRERRG
jgi:predicted RNA-binding Zn ribbon-like protein